MPRPAAELRAAAIATGWFDGPDYNYVGDGYTIPWQTGLSIGLVWGGTLLAWKAYLDANYKEPSRLHDWLYTPYGKDLIQATREESDLALKEEMLAAGAGAAQTEVVYQACRIGGGLYFGRSQVGYAPPAPRAPGSNRPLASIIGEGGPMADYKVVVVFQQTTVATQVEPSIGYVGVPRTAGWTESYWDAGTDRAAVLRNLRGPRSSGRPAILPSRAAILNSNARILGARIYEVGGGRGEFVPAAYPGSSASGDQPSVALLCATSVNTTNSVRRFTLRGIPDIQIAQGEFAPTSTFVSALQTYFASLAQTNVRGLVKSDQEALFKITAGGLVTAAGPVSFTTGNLVRISGALDAQRRRRSGQFMVSSPGPLGTQFTIADWAYGASTGGKVYQEAFVFYTIQDSDQTVAVRAANHKVGRPFAGYRGRNSRRAV